MEQIQKNATLSATVPSSEPFSAARIYVIWCIAFWFFCALFMLGVPGAAWGLANLLNPANTHSENVVNFYETLLTSTLYLGIFGAPFGGIVAPLAVRSTEKRKYWTKIGAAIIGLWAAGQYAVPFILLMPRMEAIELSAAFLVLIIVGGTAFGVVFGLAYFVNRYAVWGTAKTLGLKPSIRYAGGAFLFCCLFAYIASYGILRSQETLSFQERYHIGPGPYRSITTPDHIRAASRTLEWFYWFPAEIELLIGNPVVELSPQNAHYYPRGSTRRHR